MADYYVPRRSMSPISNRGGRFDEGGRRSPPPRGDFDRYRDRSPDYGRKRRRDDSPGRYMGGYDRDPYRDPYPRDRDPRDYRRDFGPPLDADRTYGRGYPPDPYDEPGYRRGPRDDPRGRGGYRDDAYFDGRGPPTGPPQPRMIAPSELSYMVTFKYFQDYLRATSPGLAADPARVADQWRRYKLDHHRKGLVTFFEEMKGKAWFSEKYEPTEELEAMRKRIRDKGREGRVDAFLDLLCKGDLGNLTFDYAPLKKTSPEGETANGVDVKMEDPAADESQEPDTENTNTAKNGAGAIVNPTDDVVMVPPAENQMFIKSIAPDITRSDLEALFKDVDGFEYLALSDPHTARKFHRVGWVNFKSGTDMEKLEKALGEAKIGNFVLHMTRADKAAYSKLRTSPAITNTAERVSRDLDQVKKIVAKFETEVGDTRGSEAVEVQATQLQEAAQAARETAAAAKAEADANAKLDADADGPKQEAGEEADDTQATAAKESAPDAEAVKAAQEVDKKVLDLYLYYLRYAFHTCYYCICVCDFPEELQRRCAKHVRRSATAVGFQESKGRGDAGKGNEVSWAKNMDEKVVCLIDPGSVDPREYGGERVEDEMRRLCGPHITDEGAGKFRCKTCSKLFKAQNFIEKHIITKHGEVVNQDNLNRIKYLNNYVLDPSHTVPPPPQAPEARPVPEVPMAPYPMPIYTPYPAYGMPAPMPAPAPGYPGGYYMPAPMPGYPYPPPAAYPPARGPPQRRRESGEGNMGMQKRPRRDGPPEAGPPPMAMGLADPRSKSVMTYNDLDTPAGEDIKLNY